jgi:hypothetical protein
VVEVYRAVGQLLSRYVSGVLEHHVWLRAQGCVPVWSTAAAQYQAPAGAGMSRS